MREVTLHRVLSEYARTVLQQYEISEVLYRLVDHAVALLDLAGAGVSIDDGEGSLRFVAATDESVVRLEEEQIEAQEGPCHSAFRSGERVVVDDISVHVERWPSYASVALEQGCHAVAGIPMVFGERRIGAVNIYRSEAGPWAEADLETAQLLADLATGYLINERMIEEVNSVNGQLQRALESRVVIEQAKGILGERHGVDLGAAFELLRSVSRREQRPLRDLARQVVEGSRRL